MVLDVVSSGRVVPADGQLPPEHGNEPVTPSVVQWIRSYEAAWALPTLNVTSIVWSARGVVAVSRVGVSG
jgi:hypothetical protein